MCSHFRIVTTRPTKRNLLELLLEVTSCRTMTRDIYQTVILGNYFFTLPLLPPTVNRIRLSVCGDEDVNSLIDRLETLPQLTSIHLQMNCKEPSWVSIQ